MFDPPHIVKNSQHPIRLSDYGAGIFPGLTTRSAFKKAIKKGEILVNGETGTTGHLVKPGEIIKWNRPDKKTTKVFHIRLEVVYEDEDLAVVNKPAGIVVSGNQFRTLENALPDHLTISSKTGALKSPRPVHRLDAATCGLIIIGKTSQASVGLGKQMELKAIKKKYHAVVMGDTPEKWECHDAIEEKPAQTIFEKIKSAPSLRSGALTLISANPVTGRTHQIRKHLAENGFPILGDKLYGKKGSILKGKGLFLCATEIHFHHPVSNKLISLAIEMPYKFENFMKGEARRYLTSGE